MTRSLLGRVKRLEGAQRSRGTSIPHDVWQALTGEIPFEALNPKSRAFAESMLASMEPEDSIEREIEAILGSGGRLDRDRE